MNLQENIYRIKEVMGLISEQEESDGKLFIMVGPPSVGKSTWIRNNPEFDGNPPYIISRDDIVEEVASSYGLTYDDLFETPKEGENVGDVNPKYGKVIESPPWVRFSKLSYETIANADKEIADKLEQRSLNAKGNKYVIVDMTNMGVGARKSWLDKLTPILPNHKKIAIVFNFRGGEDVIKRIAQKRSEEYKKAGKSKTIPPEAFDRMFKNYQDVTNDEGFDEIINVDNISKLKELE